FGLLSAFDLRPSDLTRVAAPERGAAASPSPPQDERAGESGGVDLKAEGRNPKAERRPSSEIRRPKPAAEGGSGFGL
ncbi:MAG: hypothetical protein WCQ21_16235, partial [Verrucomicrobiota bacterium]